MWDIVMTHVVVLGSNFGGLTAALAVKHDLGAAVGVTVVSPADRFLFTPSLIWLLFGKRSASGGEGARRSPTCRSGCPDRCGSAR